MKKAKLVPVDVEKLKIGDDIQFSIEYGKNRYEARITDIEKHLITYKDQYCETTISKNVLTNIMRYE